MKETKVICVFPACGRTYYIESREDDIIVLNSNSTNFSWMQRKRTAEELEEIRKEWDSVPHLLDGRGYINRIKNDLITVENPDFPNNYIQYIKDNIGKVDYIFVDTHKEVIKALNDAGIDFALIFPEQTLKEEWVGRCYLRGAGTTFCDLIASQWDNWILDMEMEVVCNHREHYRLKHGEYLSDVLKHI